MSRYLFLTLFLSTLCNACAFNVLAIISMPLRSHYMAFHPLFEELSNKNHSVTVINNFPQQVTKNLKFISLATNDSVAHKFSPLTVYGSFSSYTLRLHNVLRHLQLTPSAVTMDCDNLLTSPEVVADRAKGSQYDVIFVEQFMSDCALAFAGALYDAPIIGIASHVLLPWSYSRLGLPFDSSSDPFYFSIAGPNPSVYDRVESYFLHHLFNTFGRWFIQRNIYESFRRHLPGVALDIEGIGREKMKMMFSYQHFSLTGARVLAPQLLEIGGLHVGKPKPLELSIQQFLHNSDEEAVYVSFGSNLKANTMSQEKLEQFLGAFKRVRPLKVLWKYENGSLPAGNDNVMIQSWFSQLDVLCHPKVIAFVSHGGMLGSSEAASCGVPMVVVPFFGDQFGNAAAVQAAGLGKTLFFDEITEHSLADAIAEITNDTYQARAKEIMALWHDRPIPVMDSAIYWTEYVARHRNAPPSLPSKRKSAFDNSPIDVTIIILVCLIGLTVIYFVKKMLEYILRMLKVLCKNQKSKTE